MDALRAGSVVFVASLCLLVAARIAHATDVVCGVGQQTEGEMGGGKIGTIVEVGSESPHVGWYRITFDWAPRGEWFDPRTWDVHPAGSPGDRCVVAAAPSAPVSPATSVALSRAAAGAAAVPQGRAVPPPSSKDCPSGTAVVDRQQQRGTILGERNGMCVVRLADGSERSSLRWMLTDAGDVARAGAAALAAGTYTCSTNGAGVFRITLDGDGGYVDRAGAEGSYATGADGALSFASGSLAGQHAKVLAANKFGLASAPTTQFHTVCNRKR